MAGGECNNGKEERVAEKWSVWVEKCRGGLLRVVNPQEDGNWHVWEGKASSGSERSIFHIQTRSTSAGQRTFIAQTPTSMYDRFLHAVPRVLWKFHRCDLVELKIPRLTLKFKVY